MSKFNQGIRPAILAAVASCADPLGITIKGLCSATGFSSKQVSAQAGDLRRLGQLFFLQHHHDSRFFATAEQRLAAQPAVAAHIAGLRAAAKESLRVSRLVKQCDRRKRVPKPKTEAKPKPKKERDPFVEIEQPKAANRAPDARRKWIEQEAIVPAHVKVQKCPGYTGVSPFRPEPGFVGDFLRAGVGRYEG